MTDTAKPTTDVIVAGERLTDLGATEALTLMVTDLPEAEGDATERILAQILTAETAEDVNQIWETSKIETVLDVPLLISRVERAPSDFEDGIGVYVVIHAVNQRTHAPIVVVTGSINVIAVLIKAHRADWLPMIGIPRGPKRPNKNGHSGPFRLELGPLRVGR